VIVTPTGQLPFKRETLQYLGVKPGDAIAAMERK
jgi:hypothetical protein